MVADNLHNFDEKSHFFWTIFYHKYFCISIDCLNKTKQSLFRLKNPFERNVFLMQIFGSTTEIGATHVMNLWYMHKSWIKPN